MKREKVTKTAQFSVSDSSFPTKTILVLSCLVSSLLIIGKNTRGTTILRLFLFCFLLTRRAKPNPTASSRLYPSRPTAAKIEESDQREKTETQEPLSSSSVTYFSVLSSFLVEKTQPIASFNCY